MTNKYQSRLRSCVKVIEVAVLGSRFLTIVPVSVDVKQQLNLN